MADAQQPAWWRRALVLEVADRLEDAERVITDAVDHLGASAAVAELYAQRMQRLREAGDEPGARAAGDKAEEWIRWYASQATSGGEGAALSLERDEFLARIGRPTATEKDPAAGTALERFEQSRHRNHERWHDGIGYDLAALARADGDERRLIEERLLRQQPRTWHDIEALAALDTPRARAAILAALDDPDPMVRAAVTRHAATLVTEADRTATLVRGLESGEFYGGLTQVLDQVEEFHPPAVIDALFRGVLAREGEIAVHFAAMLMFLHGTATEPFDWDHRPFYLTFHTEDRAEREAAFRELCHQLAVDPTRWLPSTDTD